MIWQTNKAPWTIYFYFFAQIHFDTEEEALEQTRAGKTWGFMVFPQNYSTFMYERAISGAEPTEEVLNGSIISFEMDMTSMSK